MTVSTGGLAYSKYIIVSQILNVNCFEACDISDHGAGFSGR